MKSAGIFVTLVAVISGSCNAYVPQLPPKAKVGGKKNLDLKKAALASFAALTIASNVVVAPIAEATDVQAFPFGSSTVVSEKVVREGMYKEYEVDITQTTDDARSTFKGAKETKSKKGKYTALLAVLVVGSFIIPMAQYFWYVKDDDSSDRFFAEDVPDPEPEPKKKGWFGK